MAVLAEVLLVVAVRSPTAGPNAKRSRRRDLSLLGRRYNRAKKQGERTDLTSGKSCQKSTTAERIAKDHGVTEKTVRNAGKFQEAASKLGIEKDIAADS